MKKPDIKNLCQNAQSIVEAIDKESIDVYLFLKKLYLQGMVTDNPLFQFVYRSFYRLDNAGLTPQFKSEYFKCLERCRDAKALDLSGFTRELYQFPNIKGQNSLQFSFVTKLANMVDDTYPIYDAEVARVFSFRTPYHYLSFEQRLSALVGFYEKLKKYYAELLKDGSCNDVFTCFYKQFPNEAINIPKVKLLDFFFWSSGKILNREQ